MITLNDLKRASNKVDAMYRDEVLPKVETFRKTWDALTAPLLDANLVHVADRHKIDFVPSAGYAQRIKELCHVSRAYLNVAWRDHDPHIEPYFNYHVHFKGVEPMPSMVEVCGHNNVFGYWDGTLWSVIRGNGWLDNAESNINAIKDFIVSYRNLLKKILDQFEWFVSNIGDISLYISNLVNQVTELDREDTDEFNALFDLKPTKKRIVISVKIEEVEE